MFANRHPAGTNIWQILCTVQLPEPPNLNQGKVYNITTHKRKKKISILNNNKRIWQLHVQTWIEGRLFKQERN